MNARVTGGSSSTASLNARMTLSAFANSLSGRTGASSPARISSRGCGTGSCARAKTAVLSRTKNSSRKRRMEIID